MLRNSYFPLPISLDEITADWLTMALRQRTPDVTVRGFEFVEFIRTTTTKIRIKLDLDEAGRRAGIPEIVMLKGGFEKHSGQVGMPEMHEKEVRAYRDVFPVLRLPSPDCYFADYDTDRKQGIILMEDLKVRGVTFCHALRPQTFDQISRRLRVLAAFHAKTWNSPELQPSGRWGEFHEFLGNMLPFFYHYTSPEVWDRFSGSAQRAACSVRLLDREWMIDAYPRMVAYARTLPKCVLHGDVHLNNLYIDKDGTPGFFDSLASHGPGMLEVSYHISAAVDAADRPRWEGALVQLYLDELARNGVEPPSFDEAMRQYGILLLYGFFIWITNESHFQSDAINTANAARTSQAMLDHDAIGLLKTLP